MNSSAVRFPNWGARQRIQTLVASAYTVPQNGVMYLSVASTYLDLNSFVINGASFMFQRGNNYSHMEGGGIWVPVKTGDKIKVTGNSEQDWENYFIPDI